MRAAANVLAVEPGDGLGCLCLRIGKMSGWNSLCGHARSGIVPNEGPADRQEERKGCPKQAYPGVRVLERLGIHPVWHERENPHKAMGKNSLQRFDTVPLSPGKVKEYLYWVSWLNQSVPSCVIKSHKVDFPFLPQTSEAPRPLPLLSETPPSRPSSLSRGLH
jgi:hypothetical protein